MGKTKRTMFYLLFLDNCSISLVTSGSCGLVAIVCFWAGFKTEGPNWIAGDLLQFMGFQSGTGAFGPYDTGLYVVLFKLKA